MDNHIPEAPLPFVSTTDLPNSSIISNCIQTINNTITDPILPSSCTPKTGKSSSFSSYQKPSSISQQQIINITHYTLPNSYGYQLPNVFYPINGDQPKENLVDQEKDKKEFKGKKEKNRLSARECRKRKKKYIENLENEISHLKEELIKRNNIIDEYREKELKLQSEKKAFEDALTKSENEVRKLYHPQNTSSQRDLNTNKAFDSLINKMMSSVNKYILWYPSNPTDFSNGNSKKGVKYLSPSEKYQQDLFEIFDSMELSPDVAKHWNDLIIHKCSIKNSLFYSLIEFIKSKDTLLSKLYELDYITNEFLFNYINDISIRTLVTKIEQNSTNPLLDPYTLLSISEYSLFPQNVQQS